MAHTSAFDSGTQSPLVAFAAPKAPHLIHFGFLHLPDDVKLLRIKSFDCIRKMDGAERCFDASPAIRKAIEPCRPVLAPLAGVFSCWEQTDTGPLPPLQVFQASELLKATTHDEAPNGVCNAS